MDRCINDRPIMNGCMSGWISEQMNGVLSDFYSGWLNNDNTNSNDSLRLITNWQNAVCLQV